MNVKNAKAIIEADQHCHKRELHGTLPNRDTRVELSI